MASEDTQDTKVAQENEALIQEMLRDAEKHELPSELTANPVVHRGDSTLPAPMTVKQISSAGYVWVWDTRTHEKIPVLYYMLPSKLRQRRPDGSYRFTVVDPKELPKRGTIKCLLHPDRLEREKFNAMGFRVCKKENITNEYQLKQHMRLKHPREWEAIEMERTEKQEEEERQLRRLLLEAQLKDSMPPAAVPDTPVTPVEPAPNSRPDRPLASYEYYCPDCRAVHRKTSKLGRRHLKRLA
jgi:hypothetical protein